MVVEKGTSINPFLTMMYYRISFFAWLNACRNHKLATGKVTPEQQRNFANFKYAEGWEPQEVTIEVEEIVEYTSEEESEHDKESNSDELWGRKEKKGKKATGL